MDIDLNNRFNSAFSVLTYCKTSPQGEGIFWFLENFSTRTLNKMSAYMYVCLSLPDS